MMKTMVNYFDVDAVSNSRMKLINPDEGGSPFKYLHGNSFERNLYESALSTGDAVHKYFLEPEKFRLSTVPVPSGQLGDVAMYMKKNDVYPSKANILNAFAECNAYSTYSDAVKIRKYKESIKPFLDEAKDNSCIYLNEADLKTMKGCILALEQSGMLKYFQHPNALNEQEVYAEVLVPVYNSALGFETEISLLCKAKLDNSILEGSHLIVNDLKTTGSSVHTFMGSRRMMDKRYEFVPGAFQKYHYYRPISFYLDMLLALLRMQGKEVSSYEANMVVVDKSMFEVGKFPIDDEWLALGRQEYTELLKRIAYAKVNGHQASLQVLPEGEVRIVKASTVPF